MVEVHGRSKPTVGRSANVFKSPQLGKDYPHLAGVSQARMCARDRVDIGYGTVFRTFAFIKDPRNKVPCWVMPPDIQIHEVAIALVW
jgi:hypothetical protein